MVVWWSKGDFSFLSMRVCVCLKIMVEKEKKRKELKKEIEREVLEEESREKKRGEDEIFGLRVYVCGAYKTREKKKRKGNIWMRKNGNTTTIFLQYFHNKS